MPDGRLTKSVEELQQDVHRLGSRIDELEATIEERHQLIRRLFAVLRDEEVSTLDDESIH